MKKYRFGENFLRSYSEPTFIARGGFGAVFKCEKNNSVFAVKVTNFDAGGQEADKARREADILNMLKHSRIVKYIEHLEDSPLVCESSDSSSGDSTEGPKDSAVYLIMEFCPRTLHKMLEDTCTTGGIQPSKTWTLFKQIIEGLEHVHKKSVIHNDLSSQNIFLDSNDNIKIGDFGLSRVVDDSSLSITSASKGNTLYAAPEKLGAKGTMRRIDSRVDIYSAGVLLFELVYPMKTEQERRTNLLNLREGKLPGNFKYATKFLQKLLSRDRPSATDILELLNDVEAIAGPNPENILSQLLGSDRSFDGEAVAFQDV
ncbi:hypothetical protein COLO4_12393 [Corchorus olitorius]|uniref:Protein kinase domain-containing protein n=1 Tax=Corchorus olitorius TaxID=93759 RepID=A0A1R3K0Y8_9ROSI|nr:hypothetical protein COLO4_12393 [Corchorus olitorius]